MRVMFVDDEVQVLKGIKRMFDSADLGWDIVTATGGAESLEALRKEPVDVLVADMQMPGMDGAQLLDEITRSYPGIVRIILSGQANKESVFRAVTPMHQYLSKPCDAEVLRETITRACALREILTLTQSHDFIGSISSLPSLPRLYQDVVKEIESDNGTVARVGEIIAQDPAMTAKILQLANSAMFGSRSPITSPDRAAALIGTKTLKALVLSLQVFKSFDGVSVPGFSIDNLFAHSFRVATIAKMIADREGLSGEISSECYTAGLLHDVGKLVFATHAPEKFGSAIVASEDQGISLIEAERSLFGLGHDGIGAYLLGLWGIPQSIVEAIAFHHLPDKCHGINLSPSAIVCTANLLAHEENNSMGYKHHDAFEHLPEPIDLDRLNVWRNLILTEEKE